MCNIAIDFDGTITADYPAARSAIQRLREKGHRIIIWSSRNNSQQHKESQSLVYQEMINLLKEYQIPYDLIDDGTTGKFHAQVYIDDKAWRFENNWEEILTKIY